MPLKPVCGADQKGRRMYEEALALDRTESFGYTVQILPAHRLLADGVELRLVVAPFEGTGLQAGVLMR